MATRKIFGTQYDDTILVSPTTVSITSSSTKSKKSASEVYDVSDFTTAVFAGDGKDKVYMIGDSSDAVDGGSGDDLIYGGLGNDLLSGGGGKDSIYGGSGNDTIGAVRPGTATGSTTDYVIDQNADTIGDLLVGDGFDPAITNNQLVLNLAVVGNDIIVGGNGKDVIWGDNGPTQGANTPIGGNDLIFGGNGDDSIYGQGGNDSLKGENGNDTIDGGAGNDIIDGGFGADNLRGGVGADIFAYNSVLDSTALSMDIIVDFSQAGGDKIDLRPLAGSNSLVWCGSISRAYGVWQQSSGTNTLIKVDTTGDAQADMVIQLSGVINLQSIDFMGVTNASPTLQPVPAIVYTDTAADDTFYAATGNLVGTGSNVITYKLSDSSSSFEPGFNVQKSSVFGVFYLNTDSGDYKFVPDDGAIEALKATQTIEFLVSATDGVSDSQAQPIIVTLNGVNDAPTGNASLDLPDGKENTPYYFSASDLLQGFADAEGDSLSVANLTVNHGSLKVNSNGDWILIPESNYSGLVTLSYQVVDGHGGSLNASQSVNLAPLLVLEYRVNTTTLDDQQSSAITGLDDGGWVATWQSNNQDGSYWGIYQQRFDASGLAIGGEVRVNTTTDGGQYNPAITALTIGGGWVTSWMSFDQNGSYADIYQQRFDASGSAIGGEVRVNTTIANNQIDPAITALTDGGWVTSWSSYDQDSSTFDIYQQRFNTSGNPIGNEVRVNTTTEDHQYNPAITALTGGGWVTSWISYDQDGSYWDIYQQRFDASGSAIGSEIVANTTTAGDQYNPAITALTIGGGWVTSWISYDQNGGDRDIYQQLFDASGNPIGSEVRVNTTIVNDQIDQAITALTDGGWVTSWSSLDQDGSYWGIYQQRFNKDGIAIGAEVRVNTTVDNFQTNSAVTALANGGWVVSWTSNDQDGSYYGIYQQRYDADGNPVAMPLRGNDYANTLVWTGVDSVALDGAGGDDVITGGPGDDLLIGGSGNDILTGSGGSDTFVFKAADGPGLDSITDFSSETLAVGGDILDLSDLLIGYSPGISAVSEFVKLRNSGGDAIVSIDRDGNDPNYSEADIITLVGNTALDLNTLINHGNLILV